MGTSPCQARMQLRKLAEREGFEPPVPFGITGFQDQRHQPLGHLSTRNQLCYYSMRPCARQGVRRNFFPFCRRQSKTGDQIGSIDTVLHSKYSIKRTAPKVSKGRPESPLGSKAFVASGDKEKAERVSRNERPLAATIEAADAPAGAKPLPSESNRFIVICF